MTQNEVPQSRPQLLAFSDVVMLSAGAGNITHQQVLTSLINAWMVVAATSEDKGVSLFLVPSHLRPVAAEVVEWFHKKGWAGSLHLYDQFLTINLSG